MKLLRNRQRAFSALDLLIVIATIVVIVGVFLPMFGRSRGCGARAPRIACVNNLKQVGIGFRLYASDGEPYPKYDEAKTAWQSFQIVGKEIGSPKVLLCPEDAQRKKPALDFEQNGSVTSYAHSNFQDMATSYFYSPDAAEDKPESFLAGDRNISTNSTILSGLLTVQTNTKAKWASGIHKDGGSILLGDGSAHFLNDAKLRQQIAGLTNGVQRLLIP